MLPDFSLQIAILDSKGSSLRVRYDVLQTAGGVSTGCPLSGTGFYLDRYARHGLYFTSKIKESWKILFRFFIILKVLGILKGTTYVA